MRRYLVVANQTLGGEQLAAQLDECMKAGPCRFHLLVPVTEAGEPDRAADAGGGVIPSSYRVAQAQARRRLEAELARLRGAGAEVDGQVVDPRPLKWIKEVAAREAVDEVIISTLPRRVSRWLAMDLPRRVERSVKVPVRHVSGPAGPPG